MNEAAILHRPYSEYAHHLPDGRVVLRLRTARGDFFACRLCYGDRASRQNPIPRQALAMPLLCGDEQYDYYELVFKPPYPRLCYVFVLEAEGRTHYYYRDRLCKELPTDRSDDYQLAFVHRADALQLPAWAADAVVYNVLLDSFALCPAQALKREFNGGVSKCKRGGTLAALLHKLPYLQDLGINCLYLNPIFAAGEYHKYDTMDYRQIDPCFGTLEEFQMLVKQCHACGIRVVLDGVFNHCGRYFFAFQKLLEQGEGSPYAQWFYEVSYPLHYPDTWEELPAYACFGYERHMPKLDTSNPEVLAYLLEVCRYWLLDCDIDGWRLDVADEVNDDFWRAFRKAAKEVKPDCLLIGEIWGNAEHWLCGEQFDSSMNYDFRKACADFFAFGKTDASAFDGAVTRMRMRYALPMAYCQLNLLDSHDVSRFLSLCAHNEAAYQLAVLYQMTGMGMPSITYGDEQGMAGNDENEYRAPMQWENNPALYAFYKRAIALRKSEPCLCRGSYHTLKADAESTLYVFARTYAGVRICVMLNAGSCAETAEILPHQALLWQQGLQGKVLAAKGFVVVKESAHVCND
ncbi:MAG: glycoside hydrolase family 13 protein [Clostridia bacterium]